jgi:NTP pyrophosphatase (non-canonical NTP hydrolase)
MVIKSTKGRPPENTAAEIHAQEVQRVGDAFSILARGLQASIEKHSQLISNWNSCQGFWDCNNTGEKIALMHSELSEALEADRKDLTSDHIPDFSGMEEELADCMIRIMDFAGHHELRLSEAITAKLQFNLSRPYKHGKAY